MRVRTQLLLAFLLLAVLPLVSIVLFSYLSSLESLRRAVEAEGRGLAEEMSQRLDSVREDISDKLRGLARLPVRALLPSKLEGDDASEVYTDLMAQMGDVAELVDWLEFSPVQPAGAQDSQTEAFFVYPSKTLADALGRLKRRELSLEESGITREYLEETIRQAIRQRKLLESAELEAVEARGEEMKLLLGSEFTAPVMRGDRTIGYLKALVPPSQILRQVLSRTPRDRGEVPYARDEAGKVYVDRRKDKAILKDIGLPAAGSAGRIFDEWIVIETPDPESGLIFGVARPVQESLRDFRRTAARNLAYGLAIVVVAMAGVLWLSARMTRRLRTLTTGAERLAQGNLDARVPATSRDEFGVLARTFNRMAETLRDNQQRLLEEERRRKEQEIRQRLLRAEHERKTRELEEARELQLSLLPKALPRHPELEVAVFMRTAAEVGGDYYDFFPAADGALTTVIGDAAGHGARAGTMVTVVKGLFTASAAEGELPWVLESATRAIKQMELGRMNMAVSLVRIDAGSISVSAAGMPPVLIYREGSGAAEEVDLVGTPLGSLADVSYGRWESRVDPGDTILLMSDGFPELLNDDGEPVGYSRARSLFEASATKTADEIIADLSAAAREWNGGRQPEDDITFVVMKMRSPAD